MGSDPRMAQQTIRRSAAGTARGFAHNVGLRNPHFDDSERLIKAIDAAGPSLQRAAIGQPWDSPLFRRHAEGGGFERAEWAMQGRIHAAAFRSASAGRQIGRCCTRKRMGTLTPMILTVYNDMGISMRKPDYGTAGDLAKSAQETFKIVVQDRVRHAPTLGPA